MYAHFYQLSENPFNLTPDPKFHYVNTSTREAMASILHGIKSRKGFITRIAEAGTGKTTLLKRIVDEIEGETQVVFVFNPGVSFDELLEFICSELGIETHGCKRLHLLDRLNTHLLEQLTRGRNVVVMIDEAQTLEDSVLEELRLLSNLETAKEKILQILLSGQPELEEKLRKPSLRQLRQRIGVRATLKPVRLEEMPAYVETRLRSAGAERNELFTSAALKKIWQASQGIPRVINVICDNAMMLAFADGKKRITPKLLREAVRDLEGEVSADALRGGAPEWLSSRGTGYALAAAAMVAAAIPLATFLRANFDPSSLFPRDEARVEEPVATATSSLDVVVPTKPAEPSTKAVPSADAPHAAGEPAPTVALSPGAARVDDETASLHALETDASARPAIQDSMRRAEIVARSTAARLYGTDQDARGATERRDIAAAAMDEVSREGGLKAPDLSVPSATLGVRPDEDDDDLPTPAAALDEPADVPSALTKPAPSVVPEPVARKEPAPSVAASKQLEHKPGAKPAAKPAPEKAAEVKSPAKPVAKPEEKAPPKLPDAAPAASVARTDEAATPVDDPVKAAVARAIRSNDEPSAADVQPPAEAAPEQQLAAVPPRGSFVLGRAVRVAEGDTVWDIAIKHYGSAGSSVLKRILASNPSVRDPSHLDVGSTVFLPFSRPEQMIRRDTNGFRVVLASGTSRERLEAVGRWANTVASEVRMTSSSASSGPVLYEVSIIGLPSEAAALSLATNLFENSATTSTERTAMR